MMARHHELASRVKSIRITERRHSALRLLCAVALLAATGCASPLTRWVTRGWVADYDTAERCVRERGSELLILYQDTRPGLDHPLEETLNSAVVKGRINDYVRCKLFKPYEPDRRYVAQFGVDRTPALIVVHRDGTYHARSGSQSVAEVLSFLSEAKPPGSQPVINPHIPRRPRYHWHRTIEAAKKASQRTGQPILIVYHRSLSRDWAVLRKLLSRRELHSRFDDMVHCRIGSWRFWADTRTTPYGTLRLPAIVIADRDGTYHVLELPTSYESIAHFADAARNQEGQAAGSSAVFGQAVSPVLGLTGE